MIIHIYLPISFSHIYVNTTYFVSNLAHTYIYLPPLLSIPLQLCEHNYLLFLIQPYLNPYESTWITCFVSYLSPLEISTPPHLCEHFFFLIWLIESLYIYLPNINPFSNLHYNPMFDLYSHFHSLQPRIPSHPIHSHDHQNQLALLPPNLCFQTILIYSLKDVPLVWDPLILEVIKKFTYRQFYHVR